MQTGSGGHNWTRSNRLAADTRPFADPAVNVRHPIAPILTPLAAIGLVGIMLGAAATHLRRSETPMVVPPMVLAALAAFVAYGRLVVMPA
ncbi:MAG: DoxX family protein [Phycisphaerae bacterium]